MATDSALEHEPRTIRSAESQLGQDTFQRGWFDEAHLNKRLKFYPGLIITVLLPFVVWNVNNIFARIPTTIDSEAATSCHPIGVEQSGVLLL
jgi:hypothetical protein